MLEKMPDSALAMMCVAAAGGMVRLALGIKEDGVTFWMEVLRFIFIAIPIGTFAGLHALDQGMSSITSFAVCYFAGTASLNIARTMMTQGLAGIIDAFVRVKK